MAVTYARRLGLFSGTMSVIGGIIGSGIFLNPAIVAQRVGTAGATLAVWVGGGVVALIGAFVFGELGQRRPQVGGGYAYLREAFGPLPAFLYAWALLLIMAPGRHRRGGGHLRQLHRRAGRLSDRDGAAGGGGAPSCS